MNEIGAVETLLFVAGDEGLSLEEIATVLECTTQFAFQLLTQLQKNYESSKASGLMLLEVGNHYQLATKKEYAGIIKKYAVSPLSTNLSQAALETLAIIAYKQPLTRMEIDEIRGVQTSGALQKLLLRGLIEDKGRVNGPGRAILYGTTNYFMDYFGLKNIKELPAIDELEQDQEEVESDLFFEKFNQQFQSQEE
ncbi:MAG: SMC-Scp complex subunit ScpB [Carnobacterium sp.]|uniref:Segregation and condensation protein B n=4 Tax=Carnobacterium maltaromaticum TaxID=2751 RepID=K8E3V5_CARML|nr:MULTISPECIES: SMC-Scp complex subunit ScpB [Carnobacterium]AOA03912.1 SMC-Scp complex subunit ScpB [Carnobacterium maltaromaticum]MBQ6485393.1 SMC-Scp complex subunit ScpB [Carnobacterium sp.]MCI1818658.1 SMC-Scp complex subunit ScpB [Carnobacterium maltaromaticum]MDT1944793.1 SMC-Scp complex subunit ScpB [Carnobacterium maltaromaticum]MDT1998442.1 SMC-Scp complex subunit ScpB [Carnobacterium maltaromaticum]